MPSACMSHYTTQVIGVILALLDDLDESVQLTAVSCLLMVMFRPINNSWFLNSVCQIYTHFFELYMLVFFLVQVTESASNDAVEPILLNLSVRLRNLQVRSSFELSEWFY